MNNQKSQKLEDSFYKQNALIVAHDLIGKILVRNFEDGKIIQSRIIETEAYYGEDDEACHAFKGKTPRTKVMYESGGHIYIYFIYGIHYMLNIVTGNENEPQGVLIRATEEYKGPAIVTKNMQIDKSFYGEEINKNLRLTIIDDGFKCLIKQTPRVGIDYAGEKWRNMPWRFLIDKD